jgi:hypothetical protein
MLPLPDKLRTPLHFTDDELNVLKGKNLHSTMINHWCDWQVEWE